MKRLFGMIENAEKIFISLNDNCISTYIAAPANYIYNPEMDTLELGDGDNGIFVRNASTFSVDYDEFYHDFSLKKGSAEILIQF